MAGLEEKIAKLKSEAQSVFDFGVSSFGVSRDETEKLAVSYEQQSRQMRAEGSPFAAYEAEKKAIQARRSTSLFSVPANNGIDVTVMAQADIAAEKKAYDTMLDSITLFDIPWDDSVALSRSGRIAVNGRFFSGVCSQSGVRLPDGTGYKWDACLIEQQFGPWLPEQAPHNFYSRDDAKAWVESRLRDISEVE